MKTFFCDSRNCHCHGYLPRRFSELFTLRNIPFTPTQKNQPQNPQILNPKLLEPYTLDSAQVPQKTPPQIESLYKPNIVLGASFHVLFRYPLHNPNITPIIPVISIFFPLFPITPRQIFYNPCSFYFLFHYSLCSPNMAPIIPVVSMFFSIIPSITPI